MIELRIAGAAQTKQRQRFNSQTKRAYTPPANIINENDVRAVWREAGEPRIEDEVAIALFIKIRVVRPQNHFNSKGELNKRGLDNPVPRNKKPDVDNAAKLIMDALNTRAWQDDVRVALLHVEREWAEWPSALIRIFPWRGNRS